MSDLLRTVDPCGPAAPAPMCPVRHDRHRAVHPLPGQAAAGPRPRSPARVRCLLVAVHLRRSHAGADRRTQVPQSPRCVRAAGFRHGGPARPDRRATHERSPGPRPRLPDGERGATTRPRSSLAPSAGGSVAPAARCCAASVVGRRPDAPGPSDSTAPRSSPTVPSAAGPPTVQRLRPGAPGRYWSSTMSAPPDRPWSPPPMRSSPAAPTSSWRSRWRSPVRTIRGATAAGDDSGRRPGRISSPAGSPRGSPPRASDRRCRAPCPATRGA